jgi:uncharacterized protein
MSRLIFIITLVAVVYWLLKSYSKKPPKKTEAEVSEDMVRCSLCGVHLPKSESILSGGDFFCSDAHRIARTDQRK